MGLKRSRQDSASSSEDPRSSVSREPSLDVKIVHLDATSSAVSESAVMKCLLPPHAPLAFASFEEYEVQVIGVVALFSARKPKAAPL